MNKKTPTVHKTIVNCGELSVSVTERTCEDEVSEGGSFQAGVIANKQKQIGHISEQAVGRRPTVVDECDRQEGAGGKKNERCKSVVDGYNSVRRSVQEERVGGGRRRASPRLNGYVTR